MKEKVKIRKKGLENLQVKELCQKRYDITWFGFKINEDKELNWNNMTLVSVIS